MQSKQMESRHAAAAKDAFIAKKKGWTLILVLSNISSRDPNVFMSHFKNKPVILILLYRYILLYSATSLSVNTTVSIQPLLAFFAAKLIKQSQFNILWLQCAALHLFNPFLWPVQRVACGNILNYCCETTFRIWFPKFHTCVRSCDKL